MDLAHGTIECAFGGRTRTVYAEREPSVVFCAPSSCAADERKVPKGAPVVETALGSS